MLILAVEGLGLPYKPCGEKVLSVWHLRRVGQESAVGTNFHADPLGPLTSYEGYHSLLGVSSLHKDRSEDRETGHVSIILVGSGHYT